MEQSRPAGVQQTPEATEGAVALESLFVAQRLSHTTVCSHFDAKWVICGAGMKDTWLSRGRAAPRYLYRSLQHLCSLMAPLPRGVYWWLPLIPFSWKKHIRRKPAECVSVRVCVGQACLSLLTSLSSQSYRALKPDLLPGNHVTPEAGQYQYYTLKREAWGLWDKAKLPKKKRLPSSIQSATVKNGAKTKLGIFMISQKYPPSPIGCLFLRRFAEFMLVSLINTQSDINTAHPGDQETAPLRAQPHFDWLPWSSRWGNSYQGSLMLCNANPAPVVDQSAMIVLGFVCF